MDIHEKLAKIDARLMQLRRVTLNEDVTDLQRMRAETEYQQLIHERMRLVRIEQYRRRK
jgi:hypothetical protein